MRISCKWQTLAAYDNSPSTGRGRECIHIILTAGQAFLYMTTSDILASSTTPEILLMPPCLHMLGWLPFVDEQEVLISLFLRDLFVQKCQDLIGSFTLSPAESAALPNTFFWFMLSTELEVF